jgi:hypothetical protein
MKFRHLLVKHDFTSVAFPFVLQIGIMLEIIAYIRVDFSVTIEIESQCSKVKRKIR